jgi:hypothetical protein
MDGSEWSAWAALYELESDERKSASQRQSATKPAIPTRHRSFARRGRRR